eukprot:11466381-Ditylum_brightwellii.AAC.1
MGRCFLYQKGHDAAFVPIGDELPGRWGIIPAQEMHGRIWSMGEVPAFYHSGGGSTGDAIVRPRSSER